MMNRTYFLFFLLIAFQSIQLQAQETELAQANTHFHSFLFKEAIPLYEQALEKEAYLGDAMLNLARCYYYTNNLEKAEFWYAKIMKYDGYKQYANEYGQTLKMNGKYSEAKKWFLEYARYNQNSGYQYAHSCDFAMAPSPLDNVYEVVHLPKMNSKSADFAPTFYYDELIFASSKSVAIQKQGDVAWTNDAFNQHYTILRDAQGGIGETPALRNFIGNDINDAPMSYMPNVDLVAITSNNFMDGIRHIDGSGLMMDIYLYQTKSKKEWNTSTEEFFTFNATVDSKTPFSTGHPCLINNGTTMYYCSNKPGGFGGYDLYVSHRTVNGWSVPENLGSPINTPGNEMSPFIDANGRLYFSSDWHDGYGGMDIFTAARYPYGWGNVENLGNRVNSKGDDLYFIFNSNKKLGYFTSNRKGGQGNEDIYQVTQVQGFPAKKYLPLSIGEKFVLGDEYFRPGYDGVQNLNSSQIMDILQKLADNPDIVIQMNGYTDAGGTTTNNLLLSKNRITALANYFISKGIQRERIITTAYGESFLTNHCADNVNCPDELHAQNRRIEIFAVGRIGEDGVVDITFDAAPAPNADKAANDAVAMVMNSKEEPAPKTEPVKSSNNSNSNTNTTSTSKPKRQDHYAIGDVIEVASVFYEHGKATIDEKKSPGLTQLMDVLKEHSHVVIEIGAHTDATGSPSYNLDLSTQRANAIKKYLEQKGISSDRLVAKGYGETKPLNRCKEGVKCSEEEHAQNRRTEFKVIAQKGFKIGDVIKVDNINYELSKATLDMKDSRGLQEIIQLLKSNTISVEIRSHTDSKGSATYNLELSEQRAKAVYDYLVKNGVNKFRLKYKGYGETMIINKCKDGVKCSDSEHAENRRTDFKVIGLK